MEKQTTPPNNELKLKHLDRLLLMVPPNELRRSVQSTLFSYLLEQDESSLAPDFKSVVENHFFLIDFLDNVESTTPLKVQ